MALDDRRQLLLPAKVIVVDQADFRRLAKLLAEGIVSQEEHDRAKAQSDSQLAAAKADRAAVENAKLRLQYCSIDSPIDGRVDQILVHAGNIVKEHETALAVINQLRPVYVSFSVPQHELAEIMAERCEARARLHERVRVRSERCSHGVAATARPNRRDAPAHFQCGGQVFCVQGSTFRRRVQAVILGPIRSAAADRACA